MKIDCVVCGTEFIAERASAKYCSNRCKQKAKNRKKAKRRSIGNLDWSVEDDIRTLAQDNPEKLGYIRALIDTLIGAKPDFRTYICRNCGQNWFGDIPPNLCDSEKCRVERSKLSPDVRKTTRSYWDVKHDDM